MLRMDPFRVELPGTVDEAVRLLQEHGGKARLCAGGTDLVPNLKHGLHQPEVVVHLGRVEELRGVRETEDELVIGAMTTLHEVQHHEAVRRFAPGLADAAAEVAGPQLRRMGTLGGNLCLDTRCVYYNQTHFWREALGFCLKKDGTVCHVVQGGRRCVAAASNDTATMLISLDASVEVRGPAGARRMALVDFYVADGVRNTRLTDGELLVAVHVPKRGVAGVRLEGFAKLRHRNAIDFPLLSVALRVDLDGEVVREARLTVGALAARPHRVALDAFRGRAFDERFVAEVAELAHARCTPLSNIAEDVEWRREMVRVYVARAAEAARGRTPGAR